MCEAGFWPSDMKLFFKLVLWYGTLRRTFETKILAIFWLLCYYTYHFEVEAPAVKFISTSMALASASRCKCACCRRVGCLVHRGLWPASLTSLSLISLGSTYLRKKSYKHLYMIYLLKSWVDFTQTNLHIIFNHVKKNSILRKKDVALNGVGGRGGGKRPFA